MGNGTGNDILVLLLLCVGGSIVLAALGMWLHRQRKLGTPNNPGAIRPKVIHCA